MKTNRLEPIPAHFFKNGPYEVWANVPSIRAFDGDQIKMIADKLTWETAKAYDWHNKEIRLNGKTVDPVTHKPSPQT